MIVANALKNLFSGLQLTYFEYLDEVTKGAQVTKDVMFSWGDQKELNKWVAGRSNLNKYPLIWYVMSEYKSQLNSKNKEANVKLILFTSTQKQFYNETRALINYNEILNPLSNIIEDKLQTTSNLFEIIGMDFAINDYPNFGITEEFSSQTQAITLDYLDAKVIEIKLRVLNNCNNF